jgi:hypothetical protein
MASICNPPPEHEVIEISSGSEEDPEEDSSEESGTSDSSGEDGSLSEGDELCVSAPPMYATHTI